MDWDSDGDEDYVDGLIEGAVWFGPWQAVLAVVAACLILWGVHSCQEEQSRLAQPDASVLGAGTP